MNEEDLQEPEDWASKSFGPAELGDQRRTDRLVRMAAAIAHDPAASLPTAMRNWGDTLAAYRFLDTPEVTHEQIMMPHWMSTRELAAQRPCVLLVAAWRGDRRAAARGFRCLRRLQQFDAR